MSGIWLSDVEGVSTAEVPTTQGLLLVIILVPVAVFMIVIILVGWLLDCGGASAGEVIRNGLIIQGLQPLAALLSLPERAIVLVHFEAGMVVYNKSQTRSICMDSGLHHTHRDGTMDEIRSAGKVVLQTKCQWKANTCTGLIIHLSQIAILIHEHHKLASSHSVYISHSTVIPTSL